MKKRIITFLFIGLVSTTLYCQETIFAEKEWEQLTNQKFLADFFDGFFVNLGVTVAETGEQISVLHQGDHFKIIKGIDKSNVDYTITIGTENIRNLVNHATDGKIDEAESYKILAVLFTPLTAATLKNPLMTESLPRFFNNIENNIHVTLHNPEHSASVSHTLLYINKEWIVISGLHGTAKRTFELSPSQALTYQQKVHEALKMNTKKGWSDFKSWYLAWRKEVSVNS